MMTRMLMCVVAMLLVCCSDLCCGYVNYVYWGLRTCQYSGMDVFEHMTIKPPNQNEEPPFLNITITFTPKARPVYVGYAAKSMWEGRGGGSEYICLPDQPEWGDFVPDMQNIGRKQNSRIYGTQFFEAGLSPGFISGKYKYANVPCAVCETTVEAHGQMLMIPGMLTCPSGWTEQYAGLLMAEPSKKTKSQSNYICVDHRGFIVDNLDQNPHARVSPVEVGCGVIPCNNGGDGYEEGKELSCVVCVK